MSPQPSAVGSRARRSLFPPYEAPSTGDPFEHAAEYMTLIARRLVGIITVITVVIGGVGALGFQVLGPRQAAQALDQRVKHVEDTTAAYGVRMSQIERDLSSILYISCENLKVTQPVGSMPPKECVDRSRP